VDFVPEEIFMKAIEDGDLILSVSKELVPSPLRSSAHVIGHGTVSQDLPGKKISLPGSNKIKALYAGNLLIPYLNRPLILKLVQDYLSVDFIFCGSTGKGNLNPNPLISDESWIAELQNHENVSLLGELNSDKLFNHLFAADILLCAYDHDRYPERIVNSHKILEYLMTGNTIVSTLLPAYPDDLVHQCTNAEEFLHCFSEVLQSLESENSANLQSERREFAKKFTYENQLIRIEKIMADG
jgi:glycosyltransferase involved in cell wall biosynthesis